MTKPIQRVMLIDDDEIDNFAHQRILKKSELVGEVIAFQYATEALEYLRSDSPHVDVIFLDVNMPIMSGFEFLEEYSKLNSEHTATAVVMMLTTSENPIDIERSKKYGGVRDYMSKPLSIDALQRIVEEHFDAGSG